ncbi:MAG: hypothetical protein U0791_01625 [Gemmataceae bacterium]
MTPAVVFSAMFFGIGPFPSGTGLDADGFPLPRGAIARIGSSRFRAGDEIEKLLHSPDGKHLVAGTRSACHIWEATTGRHVLRLGGTVLRQGNPSGPLGGYGLPRVLERVVPLGFDRHGALVVTRHGEPPRSAVRFTRKPLQLFLEAADEYPDPNGPVFVERYELLTGRRLSSIKIATDTPDVALSPDATRVAHRLQEWGGIGVSDAATGRLLWSRENHGVAVAGAFTTDGGTLAWTLKIESLGNRLAFIDAGSGRTRKLLSAVSDVDPKPLTAHGGWVTDGECVWSVKTGERVLENCSGVAGFLPGDRVVMGTGRFGGEPSAHIRDVKTKQRIEGWPCAATRLAVVSPNGRTVAVLEHGSIAIRDLATGRELIGAVNWFNRPHLGFTRFGDLGTLILDADQEWDPRNGRIFAREAGQDDDERPYRWLFHPSEREDTLFALVLDQRIQRTIPLPNREYAVQSGGQFVFTWGNNDSRFGRETEIVRWNVNTSYVVSRASAPGRLENLQFSADGRRFLAERWGFDRKRDDTRNESLRGLDRVCLLVGDAKTGRTINVVGGVGLELPGLQYRISPDGRTVASGDAGGRITLVDVDTGSIRRTFQHNGPILALDFSPDSKLLAAQSPDAPILVWDAASLQ